MSNPKTTTIADPRIAAIQGYFAEERRAGRMIFSFEDDQIAAILTIADLKIIAAYQEHRK